MKRALSLGILLSLAACTTAPNRAEPSLAPRAAEAIDPRVPILDTSAALPATAGLADKARALVDAARSGAGAFDQAMTSAERLAGSAGARQDESWIVAQEALSVAIRARAPVTRSLAQADALVADAVEARGGLVPADLADVRGAATEIAAIDNRQSARIVRVQARLAR